MSECKSLAVILTCHNRAQITLRCLHAINASEISTDLKVSVYLTDDGSTDNTSYLVEENFPNTIISYGDGSLYWNGGMFLSWNRALKDNFDFYLLLNDDVELESAAIFNLIENQEKSSFNTITIGKTVDPNTGKTTYGALKRKSRIFRNSFVPLSETSDTAVTFNANCVLIPRRAIETVGILDPFYTQQFGDIDLGLRFHYQKWEIRQLEIPVASLAKNNAYTHEDFELSAENVLKILKDPKGIPMKELWHFLFKFHGFIAVFYFFYRYIKILLVGLRNLISK